jgi:nucleoid-associated protein YgaU
MVINLPDASEVKPELNAASHAAATASATAAAAAAPVSKRPEVKLAAANAPAAVSSFGTYTIKENDTLYRISIKLYGSARKTDAIYDLNKSAIGPDPSRLKPGTVLQLPEAAK